jgi:hypothetical protein
VAWIVVGVLLVVAIALTAARLLTGPTPAEDRAELLELSAAFTVALGTYDHAALDTQAERIRALSTGDFLEEYDATFGGEELGAALTATGSRARAEVDEGPLLATLDDDRALTVTVIEQTIEADDLDEPDVRRLRIELTATRTADGWRVDGVRMP